MNKITTEVKRGDIFYVNFGTLSNNESRLQRGVRPAICISNDICNNKSPVLIFVPLTSNINKVQKTTEGKAQKTWVLIDKKYGLNINSVALCEQPRPIDKHNIQIKIGHIDEKIMTNIENAIMIQMGIKNVGEIINTVICKKINIERAKKILKAINKVSKIIKQLDEADTINHMLDIKKTMLYEFKIYCEEFDTSCEEVINQIKTELLNKQEKIKIPANDNTNCLFM